MSGKKPFDALVILTHKHGGTPDRMPLFSLDTVRTWRLTSYNLTMINVIPAKGHKTKEQEVTVHAVIVRCFLSDFDPFIR